MGPVRLCNFRRIGRHGLITESVTGTIAVHDIQFERMNVLLDVLVS